jgi:flagellar assembly protein FliH
MKGQKYFFDLNNFDQPDVKEIDPDLPPPPPVFSLEEIGSAQQESFAQGREAGIAAERNSREHYIAAQVETLNAEIRALLLAEQMREKRFEREVLTLCHGLMSKLFPVMAASGGCAEIESMIEKVLSTQTSSKIVIEVPIADVEEIYAKLLTMKDVEGRFEVTGAADLSTGSCRMSWNDGGAVRDHNCLSAAILQEIEEMLALQGQKVQNSESIDDDL